MKVYAMEAAVTISILVFLVAVIVVVIRGPGGDGFRRESSLTKRYASQSLARRDSAGSGPVNYTAVMDNSGSAPRVSNGSVSKSMAGATSAGSGCAVNQRVNSISHHSGPDHDAAPGVSNGLAVGGESYSEFVDPLAFHHTDNFTL